MSRIYRIKSKSVPQILIFFTPQFVKINQLESDLN